MKYKNIIILAMFLVCLFMISAVSAADNVTEETDNADEVIGIESQEVLTGNGNSFSRLNDAINNNNRNEFNITMDYKYDPGDGDERVSGGIKITRNLTINGNGHTLDASNSSKIFTVDDTKYNVVFKNIVFVNANSHNGGALYKGTAINCTFKDNYGTNGGAMYGGTAYDCNFINNNGNNGGALYNTVAEGCNFTDNYARYSSSNKNGGGGAMSGGTAINCTFKGNIAHFGGAIFKTDCLNCYFSQNSVTVYQTKYGWGGAAYKAYLLNCSFVKNWAVQGGALYECTAKYCNFTDNTGASGGGALYGGEAINCTFLYNKASDWGGGASYFSNVINCTFIGNHAKYSGGAMLGGDATNCIFINNSNSEGNCAVYHYKSQYYDLDTCILINNFATYANILKPNLSVEDMITCRYSGEKLNFYLRTNKTGMYVANGKLSVQIYDSENQKVVDTECLSGEGLAIDLPTVGIYTVKCTATDFGVTASATITVHEYSFTHLNNTINSNPQVSEIILDGNYIYTSITDSDFINGINIDRPVIVDGNGYKIMGRDIARMFNVTSENVVFKNIVFENGNSEDYGGVIYGPCTAISCTFSDSYAKRGGAIFNGTAVSCLFDGNNAVDGGAIFNGTAEDCTFYMDKAVVGGAVYGGSYVNCRFYANNATSGGAIFDANALDCEFLGNSARDGGAVYLRNVDGQISNCTFRINYADYGGAVCVCGSEAKISKSKFYNSSTKNDGGAVLWVNCTAGEVIDCTFINNDADYGGAIGFVNSTDVVVSGSSFSNNKAYYGCVIYLINGTGQISNCTFSNNKATSGSTIIDIGVVYLMNGAGQISNCTFTNNQATAGGALKLNCSTGQILNCTFTQNTALYTSGVAEVVDGSNASFIGCKFTGNVGRSYGAAIGCWNYGEVLIADSTFSSNSANNGGAVYMKNGTGQISNCTFTVNGASDQGGSISLEKCSDFVVVGSTFTINYAGGLGGAIYLKDTNGQILNSTFLNNSAQYGSGAVEWINSDNAIINGCIFMNNTASLGLGGAVHLKNGTGQISNCTFINNTAPNTQGGSIYWESFVNASVIECKFSRNSALTKGGAVLLSSGSYAVFTENTFDNNHAKDGGAIGLVDCMEVSVTYSNFTSNAAVGTDKKDNKRINGNGAAIFWTGEGKGNITECIFKSQHAENNGGAIYLMNGLGDTIANCSFSDNYAGYDGSAIWKNADNSIVTGCTFVNNYANGFDTYTGTVYWFNSTNCSFNNSTFANNYAYAYAGAINWFLCTDATVTGCTFNNNNAGAQGGAIACIFSGVTIMNSTFTKNQGNSGGGAIVASSAENISVINCILDENHCGQYGQKGGGAIRLYHTNNCTISGCTITGSYTQFTNGGAINCMNSTNGTITNTTFANNAVTYDYGGGAIYWQDSNNWNVSECIFIKNTAFSDGGAISLKNSANVILSDCTFENNTVTGIKDNYGDYIKDYGYGAAIYCLNCANSTISNSDFINNTALADGGAIYLKNTDNVILSDCTFENNTAKGVQSYTYREFICGYGAAIYCLNCANSSISNSDFINNTALLSGVIFWLDNDKSSVTNSTFTKNTVGKDGIIYWADIPNATVTGCTFEDNHVKGNGGAIYWEDSDNGTISDSTFNNNTAKDGSAIYFCSSNGCSVLRCYFVNHTGSNTVSYFESYSCLINNNILLNNNCTEIYLKDSEVNRDYNWFGNNATDYKDKPESAGDIWLYLNATANPNNVTLFAPIDVVFKLYSYNSDSPYNNTLLKPVNLTITTTKGNAEKSEVKLGESNIYTADTRGTGSVTATVENAKYTIEFDILKGNLNLSVPYQEIQYSVNNNLTLNYNTYATGKVNITLKGEKHNYALENIDLAETVLLGNIDLDEYNVTVTYDGDDNFLSAKANGTLKINKAQTEMIPANKTLDLFVGDNFQINYTVNPESALITEYITFISNDTGIVTVDGNGKIKAENEGTALITLNYQENDRYLNSSSTITVTVKKISTAITVNDTIDMKVNGKVCMNATLSPSEAGNLTYVSSNETVVSVDKDGNLNALAVGSANITVSFAGDYKYASAEKVIGVTVSLNDASVGVENDTLVLNVDDVSSINATTVPGGLPVSYSSGNVSVATVSADGVVTAVGEGSAVITVSVGDDVVYTKKNVTVSVTVKKISTAITVNDTIDMKVNGKVCMNATLSPSEAGNLTYVSSNESVVSVDKDGNVKAVAVGSANITVSFAGDYKYAGAESKVIGVTVGLNEASVGVENDTLVLNVEDVSSINAATVPDGLPVNYTSSNVSVAAVSADGVVTAVGEGSAVITVSVGDDVVYTKNNTYVSVTVKKIPTAITVNDTMDMKVNGEVCVNATLSPSEAGNLTYVSSNETVVSVDKDGNVKAVAVGSANITVSFAGDYKYVAAEKVIGVTVSLNDASVSVKNSTMNLYVGNSSSIEATTVPDALPVSYSSSNVSVATVSDSGVINAVGDGSAVITVSVGDDVVYTKKNVTVSVTVKIKTAITVNDSFDLKVDDTVPVNAKLNPAEAGNLTYKSSDDSVVTVDKDGNLRAVSAGTVNVTVSFEGNDKYGSCEEVIKVTVSLIGTSVSVMNSTFDLNIDDTAIINATAVPDGLNVTYMSSDDSVAVVDKNGVVTAVGGGSAIITVAVGDNVKYAKNSTAVSVNVKKINTGLTATDITTTYNADKYLVVTLKDSYGNPLNNSVVSINLNGVKKYTTDENGQVKMSLSGLTPNTYTAKINFDGTSRYAASSTTAKVVVNKATSKITASKKTFTMIVKNKKYKIILKDNNGKAIPNVKVTLKVKGKTYTAKTNSKGKAKFKITKLKKKGKYKAVIKFKGNSNYIGSSKTVKIVVKKDKPKIKAKKTIKIKNKIIKYKIKLKNSKGKPIKKAKVTLKFKGKKYTAKTNSKGKATFKIAKINKAGKYKAVIKYKGNKYYKKVTKKLKVKVKFTFKTVSKGSKDKKTVLKIQKALKSKGYYSQCDLDGVYSKYTVKYVKKFQKEKGLKVTGKVDYKTALKLGVL